MTQHEDRPARIVCRILTEAKPAKFNWIWLISTVSVTEIVSVAKALYDKLYIDAEYDENMNELAQSQNEAMREASPYK